MWASPCGSRATATLPAPSSIGPAVTPPPSASTLAAAPSQEATVKYGSQKEGASPCASSSGRMPPFGRPPEVLIVT